MPVEITGRWQPEKNLVELVHGNPYDLETKTIYFNKLAPLTKTSSCFEFSFCHLREGGRRKTTVVFAR